MRACDPSLYHRSSGSTLLSLTPVSSTIVHSWTVHSFIGLSICHTVSTPSKVRRLSGAPQPRHFPVHRHLQKQQLAYLLPIPLDQFLLELYTHTIFLYTMQISFAQHLSTAHSYHLTSHKFTLRRMHCLTLLYLSGFILSVLYTSQLHGWPVFWNTGMSHLGFW